METKSSRLCRTVVQTLAELDRDVEAAEDMIFVTGFENRPSRLVEQMQASRLSRRYHLGISNDRLPGETVLHGQLMGRGFESVQRLEQLAHVFACELFDATHSEFRLLTGLHAVNCTLGILTKPGDVVYSMNPYDGGHFATRELVRSLGRCSRFLPDRAGWRGWDATDLAVAFGTERPSAILLDCGIQLTSLDLVTLREIAGPSCTLVYDASHTLGLVAGGELDSPLVAGADVLQGNTHKSFPGPHRAMVLFRDEAKGRQFSRSLGEAFVSSQLTSIAIALYLAMLETAAFGREYARQIISNANLLGHALDRLGWNVTSLEPQRFTDTNILIVDRAAEVGPYEAYQRLAATGIIANARSFRGRSILRIGVQEITRLGFDREAIETLARLMDAAVRDPTPSGALRRKVRLLSRSFRSVHYSFDDRGKLQTASPEKVRS